MKFDILNSEFSLLTRVNVYYPTRGFIASTRAFNLLTRAFTFPLLVGGSNGKLEL